MAKCHNLANLPRRLDATPYWWGRTLSFDALGQMAQQIDAAGTIVASYLFDAWGARHVNTSDPTAASDPYSGYNTAAGYITDWETGLQLLGHRYYDPASGRFLNRDPVGMAGGMNVYAYCSNSPLSLTDAGGLDVSGHGGGAGHGPGTQGPAWLGCLPALYDIISHLNPLPGEPNTTRAWCTLLQGLIACAAGWAAAMMVAAIAATGWGLPALLLAGCFANAIATLLSDILNNLLESRCNPCYKPAVAQCHMWHDIVVSCISGAFGAITSLLGPLQSFLEGALGNVLAGFAAWLGGSIWNREACRE